MQPRRDGKEHTHHSISLLPLRHAISDVYDFSRTVRARDQLFARSNRAKDPTERRGRRIPDVNTGPESSLRRYLKGPSLSERDEETDVFFAGVFPFGHDQVPVVERDGVDLDEDLSLLEVWDFDVLDEGQRVEPVGNPFELVAGVGGHVEERLRGDGRFEMRWESADRAIPEAIGGAIGSSRRTSWPFLSSKT
jgi:hypothetical protein